MKTTVYEYNATIKGLPSAFATSTRKEGLSATLSFKRIATYDIGLVTREEWVALQAMITEILNDWQVEDNVEAANALSSKSCG